MKISKRIQEMAVFIEFLASTGLAIFFHIVLHNPEVAYSIFGIGILLSLATYLLREDLEKTRHELTGSVPPGTRNHLCTGTDQLTRSARPGPRSCWRATNVRS